MNTKPAFRTEKGKREILDAYQKILRQWPVPYEELTISTAIGQTCMIRCGEKSAPPLILLHGTGSNSAMWIGDAAEYAKDFCVYAVDIPGEPGSSEPVQYPIEDDTYFLWLKEVLSLLHIKSASLAGISLGGWLAAGYSIRYPESVRKLVLLCPSGIGRQKSSLLWKAIFYMMLGAWGQRKMLCYVYGNETTAPEAIEYSALIAKNFNTRVVKIPIYTDDELRRLTMPVLVLAGEDDVMLHSDETVRRVLKLLPNARAELLAGKGHVLIDQKAKIAQFLNYSGKKPMYSATM